MKNRLVSAIGVVMMVAGAYSVVAANADYRLDYDKSPYYDAVRINNGAGGTTYINVNAGLFWFNVLSAPVDDPLDPMITTPQNAQRFASFCVDVGMTLNQGAQWYERMTFAEAQSKFNAPYGGLTPAWLNAPANVNVAGFIFQKSVNGDYGSWNNAVAQAVQVSIWEVLYDSAFNVDSTSISKGNFFVKTGELTSGAGSLISTILADATAYQAAHASDLNWTPDKWVLVPYVLNSNGERQYQGSQSLLALPIEKTPPLPDGGVTLALLGLALGGLAALRRKA